jgi:hypothetical protein
LVSLIGKLPENDQSDIGVRVWDVVAGREEFTLDRECLGGSPEYGSTLLPQIWDPTGSLLALSVRNAERTAGGKMVLGSDYSVVIVEVPSGRIVRKIATGSSFPTPAYSPDDRMLAIASSVAGVDGRIAKIDLVHRRSGELIRRLRGNLSYVSRLLFSPDSRYLVAAGSTARESSRVVIWDLATGAEAPSVQFGLGEWANLLAFSPNGQRLATASYSGTLSGRNEVKLWQTSTGLDLATWPISKGSVQDLAFNATGAQLRVATVKSGAMGEAGVTLLDASPLAPEIEAVDLLKTLSREFPLNAELTARLESDANLDPAIRAAALSMAKMRYEYPQELRTNASVWLDLPAAQRTPELLRRALAHAEEAARMEAPASRTILAVLAEARYRNEKFAEAVEAATKVKAMHHEEKPNDRETLVKVEAILAMSQFRLGHAAEARAVLADAKRRSSETNPNASHPPLILEEAESVIGRVNSEERADANSPTASGIPSR